MSAHPSPQVHLLVDSMSATGWQAHSVRGFISGSLAQKMGLKVDSFKTPQGDRAYRLCGAPHNR